MKRNEALAFVTCDLIILYVEDFLICRICALFETADYELLGILWYYSPDRHINGVVMWKTGAKANIITRSSSDDVRTIPYD